MKRLFALLVASAAYLTVQVADAAIPVGTLQTFGTTPAATEWATITNGGVTATFPDLATLEPAIQTNVASAINQTLFTIAADATGQAARYLSNATTQRILTRPTGVGYASVLATVQNTTGGNLSSVAVAYDLGNPTVLPASEDPGLAGLRVYYSLTGLENSWILIPELTSGTAGGLAGNLALGSWPAGALLYVLFIDDNGGPGGDGSYSIDNFLVATAVACPSITQQPSNTNNLVGRTVSLSVVTTGPGVTYQWFKGVSALSDGGNISGATTATLVITNAVTSDTGDYHVAVDNPCPNPAFDSANAHIQINADTFPPVFLSAKMVRPADGKVFTLQADEAFCEDIPTCGTDVRDNFVWRVWDGIDFLATSLDVDTVVQTSPGLLTITTILPRNPSITYVITALADGVGDLSGAKITVDTSITVGPLPPRFQQGVDGYTGVEDTELEQGTENGGPDAIHGNVVRILVDQANAGGESHGLLKFNNIIGTGAGQIPPGSRITSATLTMQHTAANANGNLVNVYRMVAPWSQSTATWNSLGAGIQADGIEARTTPDVSFDSAAQTVPFTLNLNVAVSVQAWADGEANYGWALLPTGTDGYRFDSSILATGPALTVEYQTLPCVGAPTITTQPPAAVAANEAQPFSITVAVNACQPSFQWTKDGTGDISGATNATYAVASATPAAAGTYRLRITNPNGTVTSAPAVVTFVPDTTRPRVTRAVGSLDGNTITLTFSKALSGAAVGNFSLTPSVSVNSAVLSANALTVTVTTATRTFPTAYRLRISGLTDTRLSANVIDPNPTFVDLTGVSVVHAFADGATWNYSTNSQGANPSWKTGTFGPEWLTGQQFFGFETTAAITNGLPNQPNPVKTWLQRNDTNDLGFGNSEIFVSAYFVRDVTLPALSANTKFALCHYTDDGVVFYLDGVEIGSFNMPTNRGSALTFTTRASASIEASLQCLLFTASPGAHKLAAEVHQAGVTTSDVLFGAEIQAVTCPSPLSISHGSANSVVVSWTADSTWELVGSPNVAGPYNLVAGAPYGLLTIPGPSNTNNFFYHLRYRDGQ